MDFLSYKVTVLQGSRKIGQFLGFSSTSVKGVFLLSLPFVSLTAKGTSLWIQMILLNMNTIPVLSL